MAVMEVAAAGIPIASTQVGELALVWNHENEILLFPNNSAEEIASNIDRIFSDSQFSNSLKKFSN